MGDQNVVAEPLDLIRLSLDERIFVKLRQVQTSPGVEGAGVGDEDRGGQTLFDGTMQLQGSRPQKFEACADRRTHRTLSVGHP